MKPVQNFLLIGAIIAIVLIMALFPQQLNLKFHSQDYHQKVKNQSTGYHGFSLKVYDYSYPVTSTNAIYKMASIGPAPVRAVKSGVKEDAQPPLPCHLEELTFEDLAKEEIQPVEEESFLQDIVFTQK
jgi:hypothetical protein